jgi:hypothetical protein
MVKQHWMDIGGRPKVKRKMTCRAWETVNFLLFGWLRDIAKL